MIIGIGSDIIEISRLKKTLLQYKKRFLKRVFNNIENEYICTNINPTATCAKRFAAKEALLKAIGTGKSKGISWKNIQITNNKFGCPQILIKGILNKILNKKIDKHMKPYLYISLSDTEQYAQAFVIIEART